jgi:hypothetical protein
LIGLKSVGANQPVAWKPRPDRTISSKTLMQAQTKTDLASLSFDSFQFRFGLKETDLEPKKQTNRPANNKGNT